MLVGSHSLPAIVDFVVVNLCSLSIGQIDVDKLYATSKRSIDANATRHSILCLTFAPMYATVRDLSIIASIHYVNMLYPLYFSFFL